MLGSPAECYLIRKSLALLGGGTPTVEQLQRILLTILVLYEVDLPRTTFPKWFDRCVLSKSGFEYDWFQGTLVPYEVAYQKQFAVQADGRYIEHAQTDIQRPALRIQFRAG